MGNRLQQNRGRQGHGLLHFQHQVHDAVCTLLQQILDGLVWLGNTTLHWCILRMMFLVTHVMQAQKAKLGTYATMHAHAGVRKLQQANSAMRCELLLLQANSMSRSSTALFVCLSVHAKSQAFVYSSSFELQDDRNLIAQTFHYQCIVWHEKTRLRSQMLDNPINFFSAPFPPAVRAQLEHHSCTLLQVLLHSIVPAAK